MQTMTIPPDRYEQDLAAYRPISRVAIAAGALGLASAAALLHPVMWFIPGLAIILGLLGLRQIRLAGEAVTGTSFALAGICLGMLFGTWVVSHHLATDFVISRQARVAADRWLDLFRMGAIEHAHQWTLSYAARSSPGVPLDEFYERGGTQEAAFNRFFETEPAKQLLEVHEQDRFQYLGKVGLIHDRLNTYVTLRYQLEYADGRTPLEFVLTLRRFKDPETYLKSWLVQNVAPVNP